MARHAATGSSTMKKVLISLLVTVVVFGALFAGGALLWGSYGDAIKKRLGLVDNDYPGPGSGEVVVTIFEGEIGSDIALTLEDAGVVKTAEAFYDLLLKNQNVSFMPGSFTLKSEMSAQGALDALLDPDNKLQRQVALREGLTVEQTLDRMSAGTAIPREEFSAAIEDISIYGLPSNVTSLEGWLFPANYEFGPDESAIDMVKTLVETQRGVLESLGVPEDQQLESLTIASIIEREAGTVSDFGKVSRVIHNRLEQGMLLQMDSTAQYGVGEHENGNVWSSQEALTSDNPWNTYVHTGLPVGPIANPGAAAIEAALAPEEGDWLYFVVAPGGTGDSTFTTNLADHEEAVEAFREWCRTTEDSAC